MRQVWAIGGGKGGIGKTLLTSNLAVLLTWLNRKVVVIDMDLGGANLHTALGVEPPSKTLSDLVFGKIENIQELIQPTSIPNLSIISGAQDSVAITNLRQAHRTRLSKKLKELDADYILLDLGAGTSNSTLEFFFMADLMFVVVTPEPTSIENGYRFIKSAFYRMLKANTPSPYVKDLIEQAMDQKDSKGIRSPKDLLAEITRIAPEQGGELQKKMENFRIQLIVNQVRIRNESEIGDSIRLVCQRYFGIPVNYLGFVPYENAVWQSIRHRRPFSLEAPNSMAVTHLENILRTLLKDEDKRPWPRM